jgi:hypothetical protein
MRQRLAHLLGQLIGGQRPLVSQPVEDVARLDIDGRVAADDRGSSDKIAAINRRAKLRQPRITPHGTRPGG